MQHLSYGSNGKLYKLDLRATEKWADVNEQDFRGCTALHLAVPSDSHEVVKVLLLHKADRYVVNYANKTAIDLAIDFNSENVKRLLEQ